MKHMPQPGEVYRHAKGHAYRVLGVGLLESNVSNCVIYQAVNGGQVWVRALSEWGKPLDDGAERFALLSDSEAAAELARYPDAPRFLPLGWTHAESR